MCSIHFSENCVVHEVITVNTAGPEGQNTSVVIAAIL